METGNGDQPNQETKVIDVSKQEALVLKEMQQIAPARQATDFIKKISNIQDSGEFAKYTQKHDEYMGQLVEANAKIPDTSEPSAFQKILFYIPFGIGKKIKDAFEKAQFEHGDTISAVNKLLNKVDGNYAVMKSDMAPTRELMLEIQNEANVMEGKIRQLEDFVQNNALSEEALDFAKKYLQTQKGSVEEMRHTFLPWLQEVLNSSEKLYLNYVTERQAVGVSLVTTAKILQRVGVVQGAADGLLVLRETKKKSKLLAAKAIATMRTSTAEVESKLLHGLDEFAQIKQIDEESIARAKEIKLLGEKERNELEARMSEFRLQNKGGLNDNIKVLVDGGEELMLDNSNTGS
ncbi:MAG: hypothetical protein MRY57_04280 [Candidatus Pacebacteria bacterium]|nr:hypothetical protein [Candidatus Paceibacterota bacterium]